MKVWAPDDVDPEFELTPMIDVVFLLIAFFMTLMSFISAELIKLELPTAEEATIPEDPGERQYISVDAAGNVFIGAVATDYDALAGQLRGLRQEIPGVKLYLRADSATPHDYVNKVMASCAEAGIFDLIFASSQD
ncbi:ExbD/TolR family protein [Coraliomargarita akajimensis]|uniref:Biopolymer transport protein ExbD/TolR n=1 Tax=Coraliomargarita akajimensis (strain DSM 45221 / IAM 15411 / JCM 23193 / KCTC 12865 / 04OKA010-24) TaxID=583355 RepID=D5ERD7_CORAD|nr:biopolymer transporter ExbD [Coraliomargarita akajimensis]ADE55981.1 Biopolymer transport protein ExbD/TolR [Coraliomargarita akajimensis DSM 45221]